MKLTVITILLFLSHDICSQNFKFITVESYLSFQNYEHFKRLTLSSSDSDVEFIKGFEFQWGYSYQLKVKQTKLHSKRSDGTEFEYLLEKIISKTQVANTTSFTLFLDANRYYDVDLSESELINSFRKINDSTFVYLDEVEIEVPSNLIEEMRFIMEGKKSKMGTFTYVADKRNRIRLIKL